MNELMQKALEYVNSTELFLKEQIPDFINQYLTWCAFECIFFIALLSIIFIIPFVTHLIAMRKTTKTDFNYNGPTTMRGCVWLISLILSVILGIVAAVFIPANCYTLLKINKAPKVFLMERLTDQIKK